jgi:hypothetical protein
MLEIPVINYLRLLCEKLERDRSYCINQIVREHADRNGCPLPPAIQTQAQEAAVYEER